MEYRYVIVHDQGGSEYSLTNALEDAWLVVRVNRTNQAVHYLLGREKPVPKEAPEPVDGDPDKPIDLTDIPF